MIFKGNESGMAEGGTIRMAQVSISGKIRPVREIYYGNADGMAQLLYRDTGYPPENAVTVSSWNDFIAKAKDNPYGIYSLTPGVYNTAYNVGYFYGVLYGNGSILINNYENTCAFYYNYGTIRNLCFVSQKNLAYLVRQNYGRVTHCYRYIQQGVKGASTPMIEYMQSGSMFDNNFALVYPNDDYSGNDLYIYPGVNNPDSKAIVRNNVVSYATKTDFKYFHFMDGGMLSNKITTWETNYQNNNHLHVVMPDEKNYSSFYHAYFSYCRKYNAKNLHQTNYKYNIKESDVTEKWAHGGWKSAPADFDLENEWDYSGGLLTLKNMGNILELTASLREN